MNAEQSEFDVIIIGGGPAGTSASIGLVARGVDRVLLVEAKRFPRAKLCGEFISPECLDHFMRLGVRAEMLSANGVRITSTNFYSPRGRVLEIPSAWFGGERALGLSRAEMDMRLLERARAAGVCVIEEARCSGLVIEEERVRGVRVKMKDETRTFMARVVIDATGRGRALSRYVNEESRSNSVKLNRRVPAEPRRRASLVAFKAHLEGARGRAGACEIYFYKGGYGGLSAVENGLSNLCFIVKARDVRARGSDAERVMREVVMSNARAARTLESARVVSSWLSVALESFGRNEVAPVRGLLAVGDAAAFIDPFTGSGMLMALESGELAAANIARFLKAGDETNATLDMMASDYRASYDKKFNARLRACAGLRRAAFAPSRLIEAGVAALGLSVRVRRQLVRATRHAYYGVR